MEKEEARKIVWERIAKLSDEDIRLKSRLIREQLFSLETLRESLSVMFFISMSEEVETLPMIEEAMRQGKRILGPTCREGEIVARELGGDPGQPALRVGPFGIREPLGPVTSPNEIDFVVVPGLAFDLKGNRLGRGKGYYDRFLKRLRSDASTCGVAFDCQLLDEVPHGPSDFRLDALVTESKAFAFSEKVKSRHRRLDGAR